MEGKIEGVAIRPATVADARDIAGVHISSWREAHSGVLPEDYLRSIDLELRTQRWNESLARADLRTWVATAAQLGIVGFASLGHSRDDDADRNTLELYSIYLHPELWGQGVARGLMRTVLGEVPDDSNLTLWVLADNARARQFYRRHGFSEDGTERIESFGDTRVREVRYRRA